MALHSRLKRINEEVRNAVARLVMTELKDPRLQHGLVTVTQVEVSKDLHNAQVWVSVYGSEQEAADAIEALNHSAGYLRHLLAGQIVLKYIPTLHFRLDTSGIYADKINRLLKQIEPEK
jgi:ribosome-binding factor A